MGGGRGLWGEIGGGEGGGPEVTCTTASRENPHLHEQCSGFVCLLVDCLTSQQHASVSQGQICSDKFMYCQTEIEVADQIFYLTQSQYTDTWSTSPSAHPTMPGARQVATGVPIF